jgi:CheY-like chemotaxis protein
VPAELPLVRGNGLQIHSAVLNLVTNSLHALEGRVGEVELVAEAVTVEADLAAATPGLKAGPHVCVAVRDTGCGMDAATVKRIFDPFFTTKPPGKGTGLGLSTVYGTLRAHGGAVAVASEPGKGTAFRLYFPAELLAMPKSFSTSASPPAGLDSPLVLVDDDPALRQLATRMLRRLGYEVTACPDAPSALAHLESIAGQCAAVITDFNMPEMNGVEFARQMQHRWPAVPLVLISGFLTPEVTAAAREAGVRSVVAKPFSLRCLDHALAEVLRSPA